MKNMIVQRIKDRLLKQNKNVLIMIVGSTGSGKSYSAIKLAQTINPNFDVKVHLVFSGRDFIKLLNSGTLKRGDVICWDEAGVGIGARNWSTDENKKAVEVLQTFRHLNLCVIFTCPDVRFVDINVRRLYHWLFETVSIDYKNNLCKLKPLTIQVNYRFGKEYYKYPRTRDRNGRIIKITSLEVSRIDKDTERKYEDMKNKFTEELNLAFEKHLEMKEDKRTKKDINVIVEDVRNNINEYTREYKGKQIIDWHLIKSKQNISRDKALEIRALLLSSNREYTHNNSALD
jgi:ABC-type dipeptide/oligopeptide/nickel transport system ATPase component